MINKIYIILFIVSLPFQSTYCNSVNNSKIDSLLTQLQTSNNFNGVALIAKGNTIVFEKSYGYASISKEDYLTIEHRFNIGSIYKELPAIAIMQLQEKKKLTLNDKLFTYLPELPEWSKEVTLKNLLQYTSGLPRISWGKYEIINDLALMEELTATQNLQSVPGEKYVYTNYSPFLLAKVIEQISGQSYVTYVKKNILSPLKMNQSIFKASFPYQDRTTMAIPFNSDAVEDVLPFTIETKPLLFSTTAKDLYKLMLGLHSNELISTNSLKKIAQTAMPNETNMQAPLGKVVIKNGNIISHEHHGSSGNFESLMTRINSDDTTIILLTNMKNGNLHDITLKIQQLLND